MNLLNLYIIWISSALFRDIATGDVEAQVKMALKELISNGFVRFVNQGYRTIGPFAKLALARTSHQLNIVWERLNKMQKKLC